MNIPRHARVFVFTWSIALYHCLTRVSSQLLHKVPAMYCRTQVFQLYTPGQNSSNIFPILYPGTSAEHSCHYFRRGENGHLTRRCTKAKLCFHDLTQEQVRNILVAGSEAMKADFEAVLYSNYVRAEKSKLSAPCYLPTRTMDAENASLKKSKISLLRWVWILFS